MDLTASKIPCWTQICLSEVDVNFYLLDSARKSPPLSQSGQACRLKHEECNWPEVILLCWLSTYQQEMHKKQVLRLSPECHTRLIDIINFGIDNVSHRLIFTSFGNFLHFLIQFPEMTCNNFAGICPLLAFLIW